MEKILIWLRENYQWAFSGIGVTVISFIIGLIFKYKFYNLSQNQKSGSNSINIQSARDVHIGDKE